LNKALVSTSVATLLAASSISAQALENSVYVPVNPCRIVDTRPASGGTGAIAANSSRNFLVSGTVSGQGGNTGGCPAPRSGSEPVAISAYVIAVPDTGSTAGVLTAYPSDQAAPAPGAGSTVNFAAGAIVGNTTTITLCQGSCPSDGEFAVLARNTSQNVVVDVQGYFYPATGTCPDDMVASGNICVDKYEASVWDAPTGGSQVASPVVACLADGSDCGKNAANPIYARSVAGVTPNGDISWYQAAQACANVGKRLPSTGQWQMAAAGTPSGTTDCNTAGSAAAAAGAFPNCVSSAGAFDMVGNLWEWTAELTNFTTAAGFSFSITDDGWARALGASFFSGNSKSTQDIVTVGGGPILKNDEIGFRCVR
jgi:hypothetical protein